MRRRSLASMLLMSTALMVAAKAMAAEDRFGQVDFPISCSPAAQAGFNRAVAMLHSFFYPETVKAFTALAAQEPSCAMAHWGIAISQRPNPLVGPFPGNVLQAGWAAIEAARTATQASERERAWIEAAAAFYQDYRAVAQPTRTANYEAAMARLHARYPEDAEAAIFYALALNEAADPTDKSYAKPLKAAAILEQLEPRHPDHPGIPHYIIHSYDYPGLAHLGLIAAARCADLAVSAPHALHMPSHIFSSLGRWQEVIRSDRAADAMMTRYSARIDPQAAANQARNANRYHSLDFLINAHLQLAQDRSAKAILDLHDNFADDEFPAAIRYSMHTAYAAIAVRYAFERGAWGEAAALPIARTVYPQAEAISWFGRAIGAARGGDVGVAREAAAHLSAIKQKLVAANDAYWAGQVEILETAAAAWIARRDDHKDEAIRLMRQAADLEDRTGKHVAMENRLSPMRELLGELLLELHAPAAALEAFAASLRDNPNRFRSFAGAARAAAEAGDRDQAKRHYEDLLALAGSAETDRSDVVVARRFLATQ